MDKKKITLNALFIAAVLVIIIFAVSIFSSYTWKNTSNFPKVTSKNPILGKKNADVQIIEYGDFQCPYCKELAAIFREVYKEYGDKISFVWKDYPLYSIHEDSLAAAKAGRCANKQDNFWDMHDLIFANQQNLSDEIYLSFASQIGLDTDKFIQCMNNNETLDLVQEDIEEAMDLGIIGTPHFYVGSYVITELITYEQLKEIINYSL